MRVKRIAQAVGTMALAPLFVLATSAVAHADSDVHWNHKPDGRCLDADYNVWGTPVDVTLRDCSSAYRPWHDVQQGDGSWLEQVAGKNGYCMTAYTDHDVYTEPCSGNNYQRWDEIDTGAGWKLRNRQTGECVDSNGKSVYMHECNDGNEYQLWN
ncbi:ricin-type beta-trefoil lectin domain protein [Streptomyces sp. NPDC052101]|uniref:RICIN domain-containing protein n=1 Tax=Streptomyces sp. NPDC052101 TaxID=3155763 RepID=UPI0034435B9E